MKHECGCETIVGGNQVKITVNHSCPFEVADVVAVHLREGELMWHEEAEVYISNGVNITFKSNMLSYPEETRHAVKLMRERYESIPAAIKVALARELMT